MPKITITFNLPEENSEYRMTSKAGDYHSVLYEFTNWLRTKVKHGDGSLVSHASIYDKWWEILNENGVDPYEE